ncbi:MAG: tail fiber domain-containing protein [candidate division Zixibacteria bacterium]|nr:tail fiber domain-containing protein [candidate division Zixibacteria bacterium]
MRASGGTRIFSNSALTTGVTLAAGGGAWSAVSDSAVKENIRPVDGSEILEKLSQLDVSRWNYITQDESIEHIGPMAQDFYRLFGLGEDDKHINTLDPDGVALAAIKALYEKNNVLEQNNKELNDRLSKLEELIEKLSEK